MPTTAKCSTPTSRVRDSAPRADANAEEVGALLNWEPFGFVAGDTNLHRYVGNGPTNATDPDGRQQQDSIPIPRPQKFKDSAPLIDIFPGEDGKEFKELVNELKRLKDKGEFNDLPRGDDLRKRAWLERVNEWRYDNGLPLLDSVEDLDKTEAWVDAGPHAVVLQMLKDYGEEGARLLHRARRVGLQIEGDNDRFLWDNSDVRIDTEKHQFTVILDETRGWWWSKRPTTVEEAAKSLYKELKANVESGWVSKRFEELGRLITSNIEEGFKQAGMQDELDHLRALIEEFEVSVAMSWNKTVDICKEEAITYGAGVVGVGLAAKLLKALKKLKGRNWVKFMQDTFPGGKDALGNKYPGTYMKGHKYKTHGHHIVMKKGPARLQKEILESHEILKKYKIDPLEGQQNLIYAPNQGHPDQMVIDTLKRLKDAEKRAKTFAGKRAEIIDELKTIGQNYIDGKWKK